MAKRVIETLAKIWNKKHGNTPASAVYIGRPSPWGNPWSIGLLSRDEVLIRFKSYAVDKYKNDPSWLEPLKGKDLECWCAPQKCHGDILLEILDEFEKDK